MKRNNKIPKTMKPDHSYTSIISDLVYHPTYGEILCEKSVRLAGLPHKTRKYPPSELLFSIFSMLFVR